MKSRTERRGRPVYISRTILAPEFRPYWLALINFTRKVNDNGAEKEKGARKDISTVKKIGF